MNLFDMIIYNMLYLYYVITEPEIEISPSFFSARTPVLLFMVYYAYHGITNKNRRAQVEDDHADTKEDVVEDDKKNSNGEGETPDEEELGEGGAPVKEVNADQDDQKKCQTKKAGEGDTKKDAEMDENECGEDVNAESNEEELEAESEEEDSDAPYSHGPFSDTTEGPDSDEIYSDDDIQ